MKRSWIGLLIIMIILSACNKEYKVWNNDKVDKEPVVRGYVENLQTEFTDRRGFKLFSISEDKKMVIISTGTKEVELELVEVEIDGETIVTVKEIEANSKEINPYILIALDRTNGKFKVVNEDGEEYEHFL